MSDNPKKTGIMGGTFDPIHIGHLILAEEALQQLSLDEVWFLPNGNPPHKQGRKGASDEERLEMVRLAILGNPGFSLCTAEMNQEEKHYTYQTMERFGMLFPDREFYFLVGADSLFELDTWRMPERVLKACILAAAVRNHIPMDQMQEQVDFLKKKYQADIRLLRTNNVDISSSEIRDKASRGESIRYYVPETVRDYIIEHGIYNPGAQ